MKILPIVRNNINKFTLNNAYQSKFNNVAQYDCVNFTSTFADPAEVRKCMVESNKILKRSEEILVKANFEKDKARKLQGIALIESLNAHNLYKTIVEGLEIEHGEYLAEDGMAYDVTLSGQSVDSDGAQYPIITISQMKDGKELRSYLFNSGKLTSLTIFADKSIAFDFDSNGTLKEIVAVEYEDEDYLDSNYDENQDDEESQEDNNIIEKLYKFKNGKLFRIEEETEEDITKTTEKCYVFDESLNLSSFSTLNIIDIDIISVSKEFFAFKNNAIHSYMAHRIHSEGIETTFDEAYYFDNRKFHTYLKGGKHSYDCNMVRAEHVVTKNSKGEFKVSDDEFLHFSPNNLPSLKSQKDA